VEVVEVSPRDGIQNESRRFSVEEKVSLIERAVAAGARRIEVGSFVRPDRVPQMEGSEEVIERLSLPAGVTTIGLVLNKKGLFRALETRIDEVGAVCVASNSFAMRNQGQTSLESAEIAGEVVSLAYREGRRAQVTIGAAFGCPFEGEVDPAYVIELAKRLAQAMPVEIALADTIGAAVPQQVSDLVGRLRIAIPDMPVRVHLHNTRGTGIANAWAAIGAGAATLDSSIGGIGGCPFAPRATGNVATEDLIYMLARSGIATGYDLDALISASGWLSEIMERDLPALVSRAGTFPTPCEATA
jgi:hydroxymethylglutaryl-CoA lyase